MRRALRACALGLVLAALGLVACDQILGNTDLREEAPAEDAGPNPLADVQTIATPADVFAPAADSAVPDAGPAYPDAAAFPDGSTVWLPSAGGNGHGYLVALGGAIDWADAAEAARAMGGHLVTLASAAENIFVRDLVVACGAWNEGGNGPWLGGFQADGAVEPDGGWSWTTGEPFAYTNWRLGEPNNSGGTENRLNYYGPAEAGAWNDHDETADGEVTAYIVELE